MGRKKPFALASKAPKLNSFMKTQPLPKHRKNLGESFTLPEVFHLLGAYIAFFMGRKKLSSFQTHHQVEKSELEKVNFT